MQRTLVLAGLVLLSPLALSQARGKPMTDSTLDRVTAAGVTASVNQGVVDFAGQVPTANGLVTSSGTLSIQNTPLTGMTLGSLSLTGNAQQNLSSLINIVAVNSKINVLLNLNVNINSTVGTILQSNLNGKH